MIAHQWRQPLNAIASTATALKLKALMGKANEEMIIDNVDKISFYIKHLSSTIDDFRDFFKPKKDKQETNLDILVESALLIVKPSLDDKKIKVIKELNSHSTFVSYANELKQVILNLIKNAEDALVEKKIQDPCIKIETYEKDNELILNISDNAKGVPKDIIDKVFDPYFSTKTKKDGTGLGLYMSKIIVEDHCKGKLEVKNSSEGAVFTIKLKENSE
jgi:C4-dicarboxylate-specific signal transduction histidine kinase